MIKVCHFTSVHSSADARIFAKQCCSLSKLGYDVTLVVANESSVTKENVKIVGVSSLVKNRVLRMLITAYKVYKQSLKINADIYHFHDPELLIFGYLLKLKGKVVLYDVHEDLPRQILTKYYIPFFLRKTISIISEWVEMFFSKRMSGIVTVTEHIYSRFKKYNSNCIILFNYPLLKEFLPHANGSERNKCACYIGSITLQRGITEMVRAAEMGNFKITLAGDFPDKSLFDKLKTEPGWKNINYIGLVPRNKVAEVLNKSAVGLVTLRPTINYMDALPVKLFEYMAAGVPVVSSNFPLWKSVIDESSCGVCVNPLEPAEIQKAVKSILNDDELALKMGLNGKKAINEKYNWATQEIKLDLLYKDLVK